MDENNNVFFLKGISEELSEENKKLNESTSQLNVLADKMNRDLETLKKESTETQEDFQRDLLAQLDTAHNKLAHKTYEAFVNKSMDESTGALQSLKDLSLKASTQIGEATKKTKLCFKKLAAFVVAGSVIGGLIGGGVGGFMMRYFPKIDDYVEERYIWGRALERSWKELSKKEQERIQKLVTKNSS